MTDIGNSIAFKYDEGQIDEVINKLHLDATRTLDSGVTYEIRRKAIPSEVLDYKEAMSDFNIKRLIESITPEKLSNDFGIAWVSNEAMQSKGKVGLDLSAKYDKTGNHALLGRFVCLR